MQCFWYRPVPLFDYDMKGSMMDTDVQILTEQADNDDYWVGVKKSPYEDDEWLLNLMYQDGGEYLYASGVRNNHFRLTTAQILELPPVAELMASLIEMILLAPRKPYWQSDVDAVERARALAKIDS